MDFFKNIVSTVLGMALGSIIQTNTQNPSVTLVPARPSVPERIAQVIERNPGILINPLVNTGSSLCQRIFNRSNTLQSHPLHVDSDGNDFAGQQNYSLNNTSKGEKILNAIGFCVLITVCGITLKVVTGQKVTPEITPVEAAQEIIKEIPSEGEIVSLAATILYKQIMVYVPIICMGFTFSIIGFYTYDKYHKTQIKKEELILRNLKIINSKLNLLPEDKETVEKKLNHLSTKEK